ncbi:transcription termination factor Rho [Mycolicibacterium confluentis]|uniref:Transcription termination factor Rho n=1 Tax=Mycolicibacterium confluentis TaxID=28047 RepID=A0A7I7XT50_9MYCO|nr:transcription termination factor Rho [Mycolicibacterium confluentis]MCV7321109.1 transcription termination factor Rho [Mycolicibacterium confluentis]ORV21293.1 transcription termination factor Rho [Mycolicibacterium confluentis]BBZ32415.1 transcription termination factor Rho [Mycolicibacterium confluentis]
MTDTDLITAGDSVTSADLPETVTSKAPARDSGEGSLASMVLPELRALAVQMGVKGVSGLRKGQLIAAIRERQQGGQQSAPANGSAESQAPAAAPTQKTDAESPRDDTPRRERRTASRRAGASAEGEQAESAEQAAPAGDAPRSDDKPERNEAKPERNEAKPERNEAKSERNEAKSDRNEAKPERNDNRSERNENKSGRNEGRNENKSERNDNRSDRNENKSERNDNRSDRNDNRSDRNDNRSERGGDQQNRGGNANNDNNDDDDEGRGGRRGRRFRDRRRRGERSGGEGGGDTELREDDVVQPVAGILDVLDNYAFVRTSGYLAGPNDVYVSMNMVRKNGLRRGDAVTGAVRVPREGEGGDKNSRQKFNPLVRLDTVNGGPVEAAKNRPEFGKLTPLYPNQRLRLETTPDRLTTRVIDLIMPIGKGQRALIVSPPKAGKTTIMQDIANAITKNNPECHLMVVLVDERPEEVTDMQRSVVGEVIASTFDRPPSDHTQAAELAIERAKRLVEQGKDVVVLLDSITRLGRAYNNASPASGRILSGGVDSTALYPPKRFLGAARNIEDGGSLTIIATAMVETGSTGDTVIFEEFKGTGNAELKLDRKIAERRVFPAVDVNPSGTRKDELLLGPDEFAIVHKLRRVLSGLDSHQAIDLLMSQLRKTKTNYEFLVQVSKTAPGGASDDLD